MIPSQMNENKKGFLGSKYVLLFFWMFGLSVQRLLFFLYFFFQKDILWNRIYDIKNMT